MADGTNRVCESWCCDRFSVSNEPDHARSFDDLTDPPLIDVETHRQVFLWVLGMLAEEGLLKGHTVAIDGQRWKPMRRCDRLFGETTGKPVTSF